MTSEARWDGGNIITVAQVLALFPRLGLPHFQRGRVWRRDSIAALLESLFSETPCGSFVFWNAGDNSAHGVPFDQSATEAVDYLVIDGQQRIRSLHDAFVDAPVDEDEASDVQVSDEETKERKHWCVNLAKVPGLENLIKPRTRNFALFVHAADPTRASPRSPLRENVLPLAKIRAAASWSELSSYHDVLAFKSGASTDDGSRLFSEQYPRLRQRILAIERQQFFVAVRDETSSLGQMADLYNRINAGGKQVETEERAFATLVGLQPRNDAISTGLRHAFSAVHPDRPPVTERDALLKREEERAFGFKLFIRVFLHVCQHHFGQRQRRSSFSFDVVDAEEFRLAFGARSSADVAELWNETARVLSHVRSLLAEELRCDDLRSLPDATGLLPVLQLLIHYPALAERQYRPLLAGLCLRIVMADPDGRRLLDWVARAGDPTKLAFQVVSGLLSEVSELASKRLVSCLEDANSIQDRYVLLLYWLERRLGAHDFRYDRIPNKRCVLKPPELPLTRDAFPEKQHLVPFSYAADLFGPDVRRSAAHLFNNIGNLTYISAQLNGLDALSDHFADLTAECDLDPANFAAHLLGKPDDRRALDDYEWLKKELETETLPAGRATVPLERQARFKRLLAARRALIQSAFEEWLRDLDTETFARLHIHSIDDMKTLARTTLRMKPCRPRHPRNVDAAHFLGDLSLGDTAEDHLLHLIREARATVLDRSMLRLQLTKLKQVWIEVSSGGIVLGVRHLPAELRRGVFSAVGLPDVQGRFHPLDPVPDLSALVEYCHLHEAELAQAAGRMGRRDASDSGRAVQRSIPELNYASAVASRLQRMGGSKKEKPRKGANLSIRFHNPSQTGTKQILRIDLYEGGRKLGLRFRQNLGRRFAAAFPAIAMSENKSRIICTLNTEEQMVAALDWISPQLSGGL